MCGIAGVIDQRDAPTEVLLRSMEQSLSHRGPDEGHIWHQGPCGLVHRRLRIIDLSPAAAQPMSNEDGRLWIVFNGEIYNYRELRTELLASGHTFKSRSDTEVILHGYESWGLEVFRRLQGMFAIALWDTQKQEVVLARDRLGKKPLFYAKSAHRLVFASELPVFKCLADLPLRICPEAFRQYVEFGYVQSPATILQSVRRLTAGSWAVWKGESWREEAFWSLPLEPQAAKRGGSLIEAADALEPTLRDAVVCRLESDVPLGCFLSGGIDSSLVAALAQRSLNQPLKTYTVSFKESTMDEGAHARKVASHLGTDHHELAVSEQTIVSDFEQILSRAPEPLGDDSFVPTFLISRATREHVTVALSGDGGDELFAGYAKYRRFSSARNLQKWLPLPWQAVSRLPLGDPFQKSAEALALNSSMSLARWLSTLWKASEVPGLVAKGLAANGKPDFFEQRWTRRQGFPEMERWMLADMETYLEGDILAKVDRASMAVGLEARSPFLDYRFVDQVLGWSAHADPVAGGKAILKEILGRYLPRHLFLRPKTGFGLPLADWFRGSLKGLVIKYTNPDQLSRQGLFNPEPIQSAVSLHLSGRRNFARRLYGVVAFQVWAESFFGTTQPPVAVGAASRE